MTVIQPRVPHGLHGKTLMVQPHPDASSGLRFGNRYEPPGGKLDDSILGLKPKPKPAVVKTLGALAQIIARHTYKIKDVEVVGADKIKSALKQGDHVMITPNHPGQGDVFIIHKMSKVLDTPMCFMAANWIFKTAAFIPKKWRHGLLTSLGAFPVNTDVGDKNSVGIAQTVVTEGKYPLTMFPEGILAWQSRKVAYLNPGAAKIAVAASRNLYAKHQADGTPVKERVLIFPVSISHRFDRPVLGKLDKHLRRLEKQLELPEAPKGTVTLEAATARTEQIWSAILDRLAQKYLDTPPQAKPLEEKHPEVIEAMFSTMEHQLDITPAPDTPYLRREKGIRMALVTGKPIAGHSFADDAERRTFIKTAMLPKLDCAFSLQKLTADYMRSIPSQDRVAETLFALDRLLNDSSGITKKLGPKTTTLTVGEPIDVTARVKPEAGETEIKGLVDHITTDLRQRLQSMLDH